MAIKSTTTTHTHTGRGGFCTLRAAFAAAGEPAVLGSAVIRAPEKKESVAK